MRWRRTVAKLRMRAALKGLLRDVEEEAKEDEARERAPDPILRPLELRITFNALKLRWSEANVLGETLRTGTRCCGTGKRWPR